MNTLLSLSAAALLITPAVMLNDCGGEPPVEPTCENLEVSITPDGLLTVVNYHSGTVEIDVTLSAYSCTNQGCTDTGEFNGVPLSAGSATTFTADTPAEYCTDQYCCSEGAILEAWGTVTLPAAGCGIEVNAADSRSCDSEF